MSGADNNRRNNFMRTIRIKVPAISQVDFTIEAMPEDIPFEGNCSAIDDETDKANEDMIREQLDNGNEWASCTVKVTASYKGLQAEDYLGGCSYKSEADFKKDGYYQDMMNNTYADIVKQIEALK